MAKLIKKEGLNKSMEKKVNVLGINIDALTKKEAYSIIKNKLRKRENFKIFTPNPDIITKCAKNPKVKDQIKKADLLLADGIGIIIASRILGSPLPNE